MDNGDKKEYTGAQMVMESFLRVGVDTIFGLPGGANLPLYDVLPEYYPRIKHYMVKHEQAAAHAADAYARIKGQAGVCYGTSGPGATNLVTGNCPVAAWLTAALLLGLIGLHLGILVVSGIFFWKWIVVDLLLVVVLLTLPTVSLREIYNRRMFVVSLLLILGGGSFSNR